MRKYYITLGIQVCKTVHRYLLITSHKEIYLKVILWHMYNFAIYQV